MAHRYLDESIPDGASPASVTIAGAEGRHAVTVARLTAGERVSVGNGRGLVFEGAVTDAAAGSFTLAVERVTAVPRPAPAIVLAQALAKGDRDELAVQAATELGVDAVIPWQAQRSISRWDGAKRAKGVQRWEAITREASKQSIRAWLPDVLAPVSSKELAALGASFRLVVLDPAAATPLSAWQPDERDVILVVGPEGGIAPDELARFADAGADVVRLGEGVLRTSTAGPAAIAALNVRLGRW
ncbi:16S rRNA (uracil(1498)-N(3))-methyltransferase [Galbitalea sp. SE-J8]|uniref:16S rRNA (uracil(1498)-N(3))-methyltransferase n=1 Tax=Galbitalea sp. SE-J8 TaxID=3054952 RepID=UPI00259D1392|nr:16S rRNA (uracil(1498)-N(3))-methyltransferase [Galbitalea sp. SE-J8]MDM4761822.1 16S rRNA (uracil(1498)-N(3))-methyltransferase [Galbitalea sp. SE-J8]